MTQKKRRDRTADIARTKAKREHESVVRSLEEAATPEAIAEKKRDIEAQLVILSLRTSGDESDHDADMKWAYTNMENPQIMPRDAPSASAWSWYEYARQDRIKFLDAFAKRADAKTRSSGGSNQRMEDDKRQYFAVLDRIERELSDNVDETIDDLMKKFPTQVLRACKKHEAAWKEFLANEP